MVDNLIYYMLTYCYIVGIIIIITISFMSEPETSYGLLLCSLLGGENPPSDKSPRIFEHISSTPNDTTITFTYL